MEAHRVRAGLFLAVAILLLLPISAAGPGSASSGPTAVSPAAPGEESSARVSWGREATAPSGGAATLAMAMSPTPAAFPIGSFEGLQFGANGPHPNRVAPPDVQVAAGPRHVVEMVNLAGRVWTKDGSEVQTFPLRDFFGVPSTEFLSDPKVRYDVTSGRWFASITDVNTSEVLLAVSTTDDPTGSWRTHAFAASADCADQPLLGLTEDKVVLSANDFTSCTSDSGSFVGVEFWIVNKADLVAGATPRFQRFGPDRSQFSLQPADAIGFTTTAYLATTGSGPSDTMTVLAISGLPPAPVSIVSETLSIRPTVPPPGASQPGTVLLLDASDARVQDAIWDGGHLWAALGHACMPSGDLLTRACIRLVDVDTSSLAVVQDFDVGIEGKHVFYPAIRTDVDGRLIVVFGASSSTDYPGMMIASRSPSDPPGEIGPPTQIRTGTGPETTACTATTCRYGDYFGAARDPIDPGVAWVAGEYGRPSGSGWGTFVAAIATTVHMRVSYSIAGGGSGYQPPTFGYVEGGIRKSVVLATAPVTIAADAGTTWTVPDVLDGSRAAERWAAGGPSSGTARGFEPLAFGYTHQYLVSFAHQVTGGGSGYEAPAVRYVRHGVTRSSAANLTDWADASSEYAFPLTLNGSGEFRRWQADPAAASGVIASSGTIEVAYRHQAFVRLELEGTAGGTVSPSTGWYDVGSTLQPTVRAPVGWALGEWIGTGPGAYSGPASGPTITIVGPFEERAVLYPGLTIAAGLGGSVSYAYGEVTGSVAGGTSRTLYVRPGTNVTLATSPSVGFAFVGWSGAASGNRPEVVLSVGAPAEVRASFNLSGLGVAALSMGIAGTAFLVTIAVVVIRRRRRRPPIS